MAVQERELGRFGALLGALVFFILLLPFISEQHMGGVIFVRVGLSLVLVTGTYAASRKRWVLAVALVLALPAFSAEWANHFFPSYAGLIARLALLSVFFWFTAGVVLAAVLREERVSLDTILGGISVYLLMALAFALLHLLAETVQPGAYQVEGMAFSKLIADSPDVRPFPLMMYFSFVTLTTLGYGDITPSVPVAQTLSGLEAMTGQLYVVILIARLVGLHVGQAKSGAD